ncbi:MAG TPA: hypothetical protein VHT91_19940 [Kofleriaceae bacterium]|jgi:hypothetical protein|nr:hypothetical protein [Kofleriaceae bacterium]
MICNESTSGSTPVRATRALRSWIAAAVVAAALPLAQGCATDHATAPPEGPTGELVIALTQPGPHGEIYHLANATFEIVHTDDGVTTFVDGSGFDGPATVSLPPGIVDVTLLDGWSLEKSTDGGISFQRVDALLGSSQTNALRILANQPAFVEFAFLIRQTNGMLAITLGIVASPRELAGGVVVQGASGDLADYAVGTASTLDFGVFFELFSLESVTLPDGTKQHVYTAFGQQGSLGPTPLPSTAVAAEFYNDEIGTLSTLAAGFSGGTLTYAVSARPDGTIELSGSLLGTADLEFGPNTIDAIPPTIGPDGFPNDEFFYDSTLPFTLLEQNGSMSGLLRMRHLLPTP